MAPFPFHVAASPHDFIFVTRVGMHFYCYYANTRVRVIRVCAPAPCVTGSVSYYLLRVLLFVACATIELQY